MTGSDELSTGELGRRLDRLEVTIQRSFKDLDDRLTNHAVSRVEYDTKHLVLMERVTELEAWKAARAARWWGLVVAVGAAVAGDLTAILVALHAHK